MKGRREHQSHPLHHPPHFLRDELWNVDKGKGCASAAAPFFIRWLAQRVTLTVARASEYNPVIGTTLKHVCPRPAEPSPM